MHLNVLNFPEIFGQSLKLLSTYVKVKILDLDLMFCFLLLSKFSQLLRLQLKGQDNHPMSLLFGHDVVLIVPIYVLLHGYFGGKFQQHLS